MVQHRWVRESNRSLKELFFLPEGRLSFPRATRMVENRGFGVVETTMAANDWNLVLQQLV